MAFDHARRYWALGPWQVNATFGIDGGVGRLAYACVMHSIDPAHLDLAALDLPADAHKGTRGGVGIMGGAGGMLGAAWLAGRAALHAGAGRVYVGQLDPAAPAVDPLYPELMLRRADSVLGLPQVDAVVVGPGLGTGGMAPQLLSAAICTDRPLLLDADALNLLATRADIAAGLAMRSAGTVLTPHPAEAARLLAVTPQQVQSARAEVADTLQQRFNAVVVLKGAGTLVAWPGGMARNPTGSNRLATAGTGDVLSGLIGALLARGLPPADAAQLGVWVHGRAGETLPDERPTASGLLPLVSGVLAALTRDTA